MRRASCATPSRPATGRRATLAFCGWLLDADIASHRRDFAGTGWPSCSTANLTRFLAGA
ncbi:hypothetical protein [Methylobacterium currus]|uniref:hypothetical protein n=1 Tax=Methylobacterium currus TaxID=2051553 RepID=UPI0013DF2BC5|nr:hypothetical protein [Methylobacterium currus]